MLKPKLKPKKMTEKKEEVKTEKSAVELTQVVTDTRPAFKLPDGSVVQFEEYLVWLGNEVHKIHKAVA
jgi:hypothetical protein